MTVTVVTDSAASLPADVAEAHGVLVVPMRLIVDGRDVADGALPFPEVVPHLGPGLTTSAPAPGAFLAAIREAQRGGADAVLVITVASGVSATYRSASLASGLADGRVAVVDAGTGAGAQGLVVLAAARAARRGAPLDEVERVAADAVARVRLVATMPSLEQLVRGGRLPGFAGWAGRRLGIQPMFEFRRAEIHRLMPAHNRQSALARILRRWQLSAPAAPADLHVAALHAGAEAEAAQLLGRVAADITPATAFVAEFSTVMVAHTGPGLIGLAWYWDGA